MHMADSLLSPAVGGACWAVTAASLAWSAKRVREAGDDRQVPLMGVMGAFVFAAQMINFAIPGTGSSGHLGGALLLTILLDRHAALLAIASVLAVQALFFADGGLLAFGSNVINLGLLPAFVAWPLVYRPLAGKATGGPRLWLASIAAAIAGLQLGSLAVVWETKLSGISELPSAAFLWLMQPIHLAIGVVEGVATAAVVSFVARARPEALIAADQRHDDVRGWRPVVAGLALATLLLGGAGAWFASADPDGLEWSLAKASGRDELVGSSSAVHAQAERIQRFSARLPDYQLPGRAAAGNEAPASWPAVDGGTSLAGITGGLAVLVAVGLLARWLKPASRQAAPNPHRLS
jgi:cobalt/nickel transport system permease protein